ncbi:MAG: hypothetical protein QCH35_05035 [Methanomicrobiaceae archaeon]|nr:hypothetical protein [Methanomicrobiaceae archaeon]
MKLLPMPYMILCAVGLLFAAAVLPASALTSDTLAVTVVNESGDAEVDFAFTLTWYERVAVWLNLMDPADTMKEALSAYSDKEVDVLSVTDAGTSMRVYGFARVEEQENATLYRTPQMRFADSEAVAAQYWFGPLLDIDTTPARTTVTFPDGYNETFADAQVIPPIEHQVV